MIDEIHSFTRKLSLDSLASQTGHSALELIENPAEQDFEWHCGILWGGAEIKGLIIARFTASELISIAKDQFFDIEESDQFSMALDFMKEYCNLVAGTVKGTLNNGGLDVKLSLPFVAKDITDKACFPGQMSRVTSNSWSITDKDITIELTSYLWTEAKFEESKLDFLQDTKAVTHEDEIEFF